jgi:hypothetical protein
MQLVQLQNASQKFKAQGVGIAAVSYDSEGILRDFAKRHGITFPLLADPKSETIRQYGILDADAKGFTKGMAHPGYVYISPDGKITEQFFETAYTDRYTANNLMLKLFPELVEGSGREVASPHLALTLSQSDNLVIPGSRFTVAIDVTLPADVHVYAPRVVGYKPIALILENVPELKLSDPHYPNPEVLFLPAIKESVPVFQGRFRISQDAVVSTDAKFLKALGHGRKVAVKGMLRYQACDQTTCFLPMDVPVSWEIQVAPLDLERAPASIQHK